MPPISSDFEALLDTKLAEAKLIGLPYIDIRAGDLHTEIGDYPDSNNNRMPVCCDVMRKKMKHNDIILSQPPMGDGANLVIRYYV